jgi:hypothetical protein
MPRKLDYSAPNINDRWRRSLRRLLLNGGIISVVLLCVHLGPLVAMQWHTMLPTDIGNALFFLPQTAFPYHGLTWRDANGSAARLGDSTASFLDALQWIVIALVLTLATKRLKLRLAVPIVLLASITICFFGPLVFEPFGVELQLDGP